MRHILRLSAAAGLAAFALACTEGPTPPPASQESGPEARALTRGASPAQERLERLARRLAMALDDPGLRRGVLAQVETSPFREGKVHFQGLARADRRLRAALAPPPNQAAQAEVDGDLNQAPSLELYLPVPDHRRRWQAGASFLVATSTQDGEAPVAFDSRGRRTLLDPDRPPATPVLALVPAEQSFNRASRSAGELVCDLDSGCGEGGGGTGQTSPLTPGLYMTYASFTGTFEGWLRGSPEFETHVLGQADASSLKSLQCAGEHAGGPYTYDQNDKTWSGTVLLFSQAQFDAYKAEHPGAPVRILVLEDDDTACVIKTGGDAVNNLFLALDATYQNFTAGKDTVFTITKFFTHARGLARLFNALASFFNSNDDIVGTAIEDVVVGQTWPGANWIVKGENNKTNGGIRLEMK